MTENQEKKSVPLEEIKYIPTVGNKQLKPEDGSVKPDTWFLMFTVFTATSVLLTGAGMFTWTSPAIPIFQSNDTSINPLEKPITTIEISMLAGLPSLIGLLGPSLLATISDKFGRKIALQVTGIGSFLCLAIIVFSRKILIIIIARCCFFVFYNGILAVLPVYITEVCDDNNRAKYGCLWGVALPVGNLYVYMLGSYFSIRYFTILVAIPVVYFLIFFFFAPETPSYILSTNKRDRCIKVIQKLRNNKTKDEIDNEYKKIEDTLQNKQNNNNSNILTLFKTKTGRIGLLLAIIPTSITFLSGVTVIMSFLAPIFNQTGGVLSGNTVSIIVGSTKVCFCLLSSYLIDKFGRRTLLISSSLGASFSLFIIGLYFYLKENKSPLINNIDWLPIVGALMYVMTYSCGIGPIPYAVMGELFTADIRAVAISFIITLMGVIVAILGACFPLLKDIIGLHWCFWIFTGNCLIGAFLVYKFLPETKGKSIVEIQSILNGYKL